MRIRLHPSGQRSAPVRAFTLVEVVFAMGIVGVLFLALYAGLSSGFAIIKLARENTRATQILVEKMETIRLYNWDQINSNGFLLTNFSVRYYPVGGATNGGTLYNGSISIMAAPLATSYADDMKKVTVTLDWKTGDLPRTRSISTYVSRNGLQNYIY
jgi:prepilin-type N-terminal cleavage/methylation domain-containing protein